MKKFPGTKLLVTDTDSFCYEIPSEKDIYEQINDHQVFDFSNYPKDHPLYSEQYRVIPGLFKDEFGGKIVQEFVGLRPKMYSIKLLDGKRKATAKGVNKSLRDNEISHQDYKNSLFLYSSRVDKMTRIISKNHNQTISQARKYSNQW